jgi:TatD DNase family protein
MHDAHIHLAMEPLKSNISEIVDRFISAGGKYILTQGTEIEDFNDTLEIANSYRDIVHVALGIHPTVFEENTVYKGFKGNISKKSQKLIDKFKESFNKNLLQLKAIGETGLDYYQMNLNRDIPKDIKEELKQIQKDSFKQHLNLALENDLPLSIHARDLNGNNECVEDVLKLVAQEGRGLLKGCFHSYTGDIKYVDDILDLGFHIGFNAIITYKSGSDVREILKRTPIERILFETDGPFLPPQSVRKDKKITEKFAQPFDVKEIMGVAAEVKNVTIERMEKETDGNYERVFLGNHTGTKILRT